MQRRCMAVRAIDAVSSPEHERLIAESSSPRVYLPGQTSVKAALAGCRFGYRPIAWMPIPWADPVLGTREEIRRAWIGVTLRFTLVGEGRARDTILVSELRPNNTLS